MCSRVWFRFRLLRSLCCFWCVEGLEFGYWEGVGAFYQREVCTLLVPCMGWEITYTALLVGIVQLVQSNGLFAY